MLCFWKCLLFAACGSVVFAQEQPPALAQQSHDLLDRALQDKNPDTRKEAVIALSLAGAGDPYAGWLEAKLDDKDVLVRVAAVESLADQKSKRAIEALRKALNDDTPEVSFAAAKALWVLNDPAGRSALLEVVGGGMRTSSGFITKQKRDALRMLHTPRPMLLFALRTGMGFVPVPGLGEGVSSMQGILLDPSVSGRAAAALLLGRDKSPETLAALKEALGDKDWSVRAAAVHAISLRNDASLQPDLAALFDDKKDSVRLRAAAGWARLEMVKSRPARKRAPAPALPKK